MNTIGVIKQWISASNRPLLIRVAIATVVISTVVALMSAIKTRTQNHYLSVLQSLAEHHGAFLQADSLVFNVATLSPGATLSGLSLSHGSYDSRLDTAKADVSTTWGNIFTGNSTPSLVVLSNAELTLNLSDNHSAQSPTYSDQTRTSADLFRLLTQPLPLPETHLKLQNIAVHLTDEHQQALGTLNLNGYIDSNSQLSKGRLELDGTVTNHSVSTTVIIETRNNTPLHRGSTLNIDSLFSDSSLTTALVVEESTQQSPATVSIKTTGTGLRDLMETVGGPSLSSLDLSGALTISEDNLLAKGITLSLDNTSIKADLEISNKGDKPKITLNVSSGSIPLDEILPNAKPTVKIKTNPTPPDSYLLSRSPPAFYQWVKNWDTQTRINISSLEYLGYEIADLTVHASIENSKALLAINSSQFASGILASRAQYEISPDTAPTGFVTVSIQSMNLEKFSIEPDVNNIITAGTLTTETELWFEGLSSAELAASLDGDLYVLLENGAVDSMAVEVAGADIMESLRLLFKRELQQIDVKCGYANVHFDSGLAELDHFLIDSDDTLFSASGTVNLNDETLDLTFNPIPHDASLFTATTPIHIKGTLAKPKFRPGKKLYARIAAAAVLVSLTGPAAALLPFIGIGDGGESSSCNDLFASE